MRSREDMRAVWTAVLAWVAMCALLWVSCDQCAEVRAESPYSPGDTLTIKMTARDSLGVAVSPDTTRFYVYRYGVVVDSSNTYPGSIASLPGAPKTLYLNYVIPTTWGNSYALDFVALGTGDGLTDELVVSPATVRVNATVDSVRAVAYASLVDSARAVATVALTDTVRHGHVDSADVVLNVDLVDLVTSVQTVAVTELAEQVWNVGHVDSVGVTLNVDLVDLVTNVAHVDDVDTVLYVADVDSARVVNRAWDVRGGHLDTLDLALVAAEIAEDLTPDSIRAVGRAWDVRGGHLDTLDLALVAAEITEDLTPDSIRAVGRTWDVRGGHIDSADVALVAVELTEEITAQVDSVAWVGFVDTTRFVFRADSVTVLDEALTVSVGAIDTIAPAAIADFWRGIEENQAAIVTHDSCDDCELMYNGQPASGLVKLTRRGDVFQQSTVVAQAQAVAGQWWARVPLAHARPDTVYLWAWDGVRYLAEGERIIIEEDE